MPSVAVLGGGVAGLSAAHELAQRGFTVTVYEQRSVFGGKARSMSVPGSGTDGRQDLPGEHGFRFFPGFYQHITDTMQRIPFGNGRTCYENLVVATRILLARAGKAETIWAGLFPQTLSDWEVVLKEMFTNLEIPPEQTHFFINQMLGLATSCDARYLAEFEDISFWDFMEAGRMTENYQKYLAQGFTRSLVAMQAEIGSTRTVGRILWQLFYGFMIPGRVFDRLLNGPTNDVWIQPWVTYLTHALNVRLVPNAKTLAFNIVGQEMTGATVEIDGVAGIVTADYYVAAMPIEIMQTLVTAPMKAIAPSIANLDKLQTAWMNGIQFYLKTDEPLTNGHAIYLDSNWALTSISQRQFWSSYDFTKFGAGDVGGILSVDISNWVAKGNFNNKAAKDCATREEIALEVWAQLKCALDVDGSQQIEDSNRVSWFLDPDIQLPNPTGTTNLEPLLINTAGSLQYRPDAQIEIDRLFLASDYVRTYTDLATMEGANEAARRATNAILNVSGSTATPCQLFTFYIPEGIQLAQAIDLELFKMGRPNMILGRKYPLPAA